MIVYAPTQRQLEAYALRLSGRKYAEIGFDMGISGSCARQYVVDAERRLRRFYEAQRSNPEWDLGLTCSMHVHDNVPCLRRNGPHAAAPNGRCPQRACAAAALADEAEPMWQGK
jgi:hypothetical protein